MLKEILRIVNSSQSSVLLRTSIETSSFCYVVLAIFWLDCMLMICDFHHHHNESKPYSTDIFSLNKWPVSFPDSDVKMFFLKLPGY